MRTVLALTAYAVHLLFQNFVNFGLIKSYSLHKSVFIILKFCILSRSMPRWWSKQIISRTKITRTPWISGPSTITTNTWKTAKIRRKKRRKTLNLRASRKMQKIPKPAKRRGLPTHPSKSRTCWKNFLQNFGDLSQFWQNFKFWILNELNM